MWAFDLADEERLIRLDPWVDSVAFNPGVDRFRSDGSCFAGLTSRDSFTGSMEGLSVTLPGNSVSG